MCLQRELVKPLTLSGHLRIVPYGERWLSVRCAGRALKRQSFVASDARQLHDSFLPCEASFSLSIALADLHIPFCPRDTTADKQKRGSGCGGWRGSVMVSVAASVEASVQQVLAPNGLRRFTAVAASEVQSASTSFPSRQQMRQRALLGVSQAGFLFSDRTVGFQVCG